VLDWMAERFDQFVKKDRAWTPLVKAIGVRLD
jgi:hypothetical protein